MPVPKYNPALISVAKQLRQNMTVQEKQLWYKFLRHYPHRFVRQKVLGMYIADFYCAKAKLVIELDGSQHYTPAHQLHDFIRTEFLKSYHITVLRIPNNAVTENFEGVCKYIHAHIENSI